MDHAETPLRERTVREIDRRVDTWLVDEDVPGTSVAIVDREGVVYANGYGARDTGERAPATPASIYGVGSLAKPVTALVVLRLVARGDVGLDDPICDHLPVLADIPGEPVTVADLLSHASGLPRDFVTARDNVVTRETLFRHVDRAADDRLTDRDRYMYFNSGYLLLGELVAAAEGRPFHAVAREEVFDPLGVERATFDPGSLGEFDDVATGYRNEGEDRAPVSLTEVAGAGASGGLLASVTAMGRLVRCVLDGGEGLLPTDLFEAATSRQSPPLPTTDGSDPGYGYGWAIGEFLDERLLEHQGSIFFSGGYVGALPERGLGVAVGFNADGAGRPTVTLGRALLARAAGEDPLERVRMLAVETKLDAVVGAYETRTGEQSVTVERAPVGRVAVTIEEMSLTLHATPETDDPDDLTFTARMGDGSEWPVEFRETADGMALLLSTAKWTTRFERA